MTEQTKEDADPRPGDGRRHGGPVSSAATRFSVRKATAKDVPTLSRHRKGMWTEIGKDSAASIEESSRAYAKWVRRMMGERRFVGFIVTCPGGLAGSGAVWLREEQPRPGLNGGLSPYLLSMYTEPGFRRSGVATAIVEAALDWSRAKGYRKLELHASTAGRPVYEAMGFERTWEMRRALE